VNKNCGTKLWGSGITHCTSSGLLSAFVVATLAITSGQDKKDEITLSPLSNQATPDAITPPAGNSAFLVGHAVGTQGYVCLPASSGASWTVTNARPEATLFTKSIGAAVQIMTHFLVGRTPIYSGRSPVENPTDVGPKPHRFGDATWQSSVDGSEVWAQKTNAIHAGSNASCPNGGAIDCLLLQTIGSEPGPGGGKMLTKTTYIQRLNTSGGSAPTSGCSGPTDIGRQILVPYSADYHFFRADE
jgi:uncharacterized protein DUF3455